MLQLDFNSIKVRLERLNDYITFSSLTNFNSIKVRLEQLSRRFPSRYTVFQFHKGAIRTAERAADVEKNKDFNSIKVRLEPEIKDEVTCILDISIP